MDRLITPETLKHPKIGQIHFAQVGAGKKSDTRLDAESHANHFSTYAVAVNHPGGGKFIPNPKLRDLIHIDYETAAANEVVGAMRLLRDNGVEAIVFAARSAGVSAELAAAKALQAPRYLEEDLPPILGVYGAEPVAWQKRTVQDGAKDYESYNQRQKTAMDADALLEPALQQYVHPEHHGLGFRDSIVRAVRIGGYFLNDRYHTAEIMASDDSARIYAPYIALMMPDTALQIDFAEQSLGASQETIEKSKQLLEGERFGMGEAPLSINRVEGTWHTSFDRRSFFAERMAPVVQWAIQQV